MSISSGTASTSRWSQKLPALLGPALGHLPSCLPAGYGSGPLQAPSLAVLIRPGHGTAWAGASEALDTARGARETPLLKDSLCASFWVLSGPQITYKEQPLCYNLKNLSGSQIWYPRILTLGAHGELERWQILVVEEHRSRQHSGIFHYFLKVLFWQGNMKKK